MLVSKLTALVFGFSLVLVSFSFGAAIRGASGLPYNSLGRALKSPVSTDQRPETAVSERSGDDHGEATSKGVPGAVALLAEVKVTGRDKDRYDSDVNSHSQKSGYDGYSAEKRKELVKKAKKTLSSSVADEDVTVRANNQERLLSATKNLQMSQVFVTSSRDTEFPAEGERRVKEEEGEEGNLAKEKEEVETRWSSSKSRCTFRSAPPEVPFPDAFVEYSRSLEPSPNPDNQTDDLILGNLLPEGCHYMERQKNVMCSGANMTSIPEFDHARNIETLHFSGTSIMQVTNLDPLPRSLKALHFSHGKLKIFDGRNLNRVSGLESLSLDSNFISSWSFVSTFYSKGGFADKITIKLLDIRNNQITYPPQPHGDNETVLPYLETLVLNDNPLCYLPDTLFKPLRESNVTRLYLKNCNINEFYGSPLSYLPNLEVLDLTNNRAINDTELRDLLLPLRRLKELSIASNNYQTVPTRALSLVNGTLEKLDLHSSTFACLDNSSFPVMPILTRLDLKYCRISSIQEHTFQGFPMLQELNLDGNILTTVPPEVLLPSLQILTLSDNPRDNGNNGEQFSMNNVSFQGMVNLKTITLDKVIMERINSTYFNDLYNLEELYLTECKIKSIENFSFVNLTKLQRLHLSGNYISTLYNDSLAGLVNLTYLDLSNNNLEVKKRMVPYRASEVLSLDARSDTQEIDRVLETARAPSPLIPWLSRIQRHARGAGTLEWEVEDLQKRILVTLPFSDLISLQTLNISENKIVQLFPEVFHNLTNLLFLDINNNRLMTWDEPVFGNILNLKELHLRTNLLDSITNAMEEDFRKESLKLVDLQNNSFKCDCSINKFNGSLNTSNFLNWPYQCMEGEADVPMDDYISRAPCNAGTRPEDPIRIRSIIIGSILSGLLVVVSVTVYRKRWYVRYFVYTVRMRTKGVQEDSDKYLYDTFVCYSQADRQWVFEHLVAKLEDGGRYRVCIHERDFIVGQEITDNIISSVERSRKVIVVLSPPFIRSSWCMFELQMASNKILDERKSKLIMLLLERIPDEEQPKKLKYLLKTRTYIEWVPDLESQKLFWARLLRAIAKPSDSEAITASTKL
ncbi:toll-like receptor 13 isoform X2 [Penaeus japonicus]|uniref:toll-like receptor 13 isoform X2 n=1 Tax=Penaeus japonicus TaxID=27405 RepID=UPI001C70FF1C|nr:toll-like receptor 13 isoform X2 [Penaeus japonicus]